MMNPGTPFEEAGETARSVIESFKSTPVALAILLFNVILLGGLFYGAHLAAERWQKMVEITMKQCGPHEPMRLQSDESHPEQPK